MDRPTVESSEQEVRNPILPQEPTVTAEATPQRWLARVRHFTGLAVPDPYKEDLKSALRVTTANGLWVLSILGAVLFPLFLILDAVLYPEKVAELAMVRAVTTAAGTVLILVLYVTDRQGTLPRYSRILAWVFAAIYAGGLDGLILIAGGMDTPYYAGMNLVLLATSTGLPLPIWEMALLLTSIIVQLNLLMHFLDPVQTSELIINANFFLGSTLLIGLIINANAQRLRVIEFLQRREIEAEKARSERLLLNILPKEVADELKAHGRVQARYIPSCTILFSDFVGFTSMSTRVDPSDLVQGLDKAFSQFDEIITRRGLEKLKTIGDAYMCAGGVLGDSRDHLIACILAGLEMIEALESGDLMAPDGSQWKMRLGIHTGPVVAGVIGNKKFTYDLWGDTVNMASRMQSTGQPASLNMAADIYRKAQRFFEGEDRGYIPVRGKGPVAMTRVTRLRPEFSADASGRKPNEHFFEELERWLSEGDEKQVAEESRVMSPPRQILPEEFDPLSTFAMLIPEDRERLLEVADHVPVQEGQVLIQEGQDLSVLFLVVKGLFGVRINRNDVDIEVALLGPGEIIGELSFVSMEPASATVVALEDGSVLRFDLNRLQRMHKDLPGIGARLFHSFALVLAKRVRIANARLFSIGTDTAPVPTGSPRPFPDSADTSELPVDLLQALRGLQIHLHPLVGADPDTARHARKKVAEACNALVEAFAADPEATPGDLAARAWLAQREVYRFLMRSELLQRCHQRSRFDHSVVQAVLSRTPLSDDPLGRLIDEWFVDSPLAQAIRQSAQTISDHIVRSYRSEKPLWRIASFATHSAPELFMALESLGRPGNMRLTVVDDNLANLSAAGQQAEALGLRKQFTFVRAEVAGVGRVLRTRLRLVPQDMIVVQHIWGEQDEAGLIDFLEEIHSLLVPGGTLLLGQFVLPDTFKLFMEYILNCPIKNRDEDAMTEVVQKSSFGSNVVHLPSPGAGGCSFIEMWRET